MSDPQVAEALAAMKDGRFLEAGVLYERAAIGAHGAGDTKAMIGCALMAVNGYAYTPDVDQALRVAFSTLDVLKRTPLASEIPEFAKNVLRTFRKQDLAAAVAQFSARVEQLNAAPTAGGAPLPKFCSGCGKPVNAAEVVHPTPTTSACRHCGSPFAR